MKPWTHTDIERLLLSPQYELPLGKGTWLEFSIMLEAKLMGGGKRSRFTSSQILWRSKCQIRTITFPISTIFHQAKARKSGITILQVFHSLEEYQKNIQSIHKKMPKYQTMIFYPIKQNSVSIKVMIERPASTRTIFQSLSKM